MKPKTIRYSSQFLLLLLMPLGFWASGCGKSAPEVHPAESRRVAARTFAVQMESSTDTYLASGDVRSRTVSLLTAKVPGYVRRVLVREGQKVTAGQVLAEIDSAELGSQNQKALAGSAEAQQARTEVVHAQQAAASAVKAAEAQQKLAADTYRRFQALLAKESVSRQEFDEVEARYHASQAQLDQARQALEALKAKQSQVEAKIQQAQADVAGTQTYLSYLRITAPFAGVVTRRHVDPGALAAPGVPLLAVEDDAHLQLEVSVPETLRWKIQESAPILADVEAAELLRQEVKPLEIPAAADPGTRSFLFKLVLPDSPRLRSGMYGRARFPVGVREALKIPAGCLVRKGQLEGVFAVDSSGRAEWRLVKSGEATDQRVEILSGLKSGDKVVENPPADLMSGDSIEVRS